MHVRVSRWGGSLAVRLPKEFAEQLSLAEGQTVDLTLEGDSLRLLPKAPARIPRYRLADLLAECDPNDAPELIDFGPDVGAEIIADDYSRRPRDAE